MTINLGFLGGLGFLLVILHGLLVGLYLDI